MATINGTSGNDTLTGTDDDDIIDGLAGNDRIETGGGSDHVTAGGGDDRVYSTSSGGVVDGGDGFDTLTANFTQSTADVAVEIGDSAEANGVTFTNFEKFFITTGVGDDFFLVTRPVYAYLSGSDGYDTLRYVSSEAQPTDIAASGSAGGQINGTIGDLLAFDFFDHVEFIGGSYDDAIVLQGQFNRDGLLINGGGGSDILLIDLTTYQSGSTLVVNADNTIASNRGSFASLEEFMITGGAFGDHFVTGDADDRLEGGDGNDLLNGGGGDDEISGGNGDDSLVGGDGADRLSGGLGADRMSGGAGDDTFYVDAAGDVLVEDLNAGVDTVYASVSLMLSNNIETVSLLGSGNLYCVGNDVGNLLIGNSGKNSLQGLAGDDILRGGFGNDTLDGGAGIDKLYGEYGDDIYIVSDATDYVFEAYGQGTDLVRSSVNLTLRANVENLTLTGSASIYGKGNELANVITGNDAANKLYGFADDDVLKGGLGNDTLDGGAGVDRMYGGAGDDIYMVNDTTDYAYELAGEGIDRVYASITHTLRAEIEYLTLTGTAAINGTGNALANTITGNVAANNLRGGEGDDRLYGGDGNDALIGGIGRDFLHGDGGADRFFFDDGEFGGATASTADIVYDFSHAEGDRIHLALADANTALAGDQAFAFVGDSAFSGAAGELRYEQIGGRTYVQGDTDGDGVADFWIRIEGLHALTASDFIL